MRYITVRTENDISDIADFDAWSGGKWTRDKIADADKGEEFIDALLDIYPDGLTDCELNDLLWHDSEYCFELVGLNEDGEIPEEEEEEEEEEI